MTASSTWGCDSMPRQGTSASLWRVLLFLHARPCMPCAADAGLCRPHPMCNLVNALVMPSLSCGCEMWFWHHDAINMVTKVLDGVHQQFLRGLLGVKRTTHPLIALARFGSIRLVCIGNKLTSSGSASAMLLALQLTTHFSGRCLTAQPK